MPPQGYYPDEHGMKSSEDVRWKNDVQSIRGSMRAASSETRQREQSLRDVFTRFDLDKSGYIEANELRQLGRARRELGHKESPWTIDRNTRFVQLLDGDGDGKVDEEEFVKGFEPRLPKDDKAFQEVIKQFNQVAVHVQARKRNRKDDKELAGSPLLRRASLVSTSTPQEKEKPATLKEQKEQKEQQRRKEEQELRDSPFLKRGANLSTYSKPSQQPPGEDPPPRNSPQPPKDPQLLERQLRRASGAGNTGPAAAASGQPPSRVSGISKDRANTDSVSPPGSPSRHNSPPRTAATKHSQTPQERERAEGLLKRLEEVEQREAQQLVQLIVAANAPASRAPPANSDPSATKEEALMRRLSMVEQKDAAEKNAQASKALADEAEKKRRDEIQLQRLGFNSPVSSRSPASPNRAKPATPTAKKVPTVSAVPSRLLDGPGVALSPKAWPTVDTRRESISSANSQRTGRDSIDSTEARGRAGSSTQLRRDSSFDDPPRRTGRESAESSQSRLDTPGRRFWSPDTSDVDTPGRPRSPASPQSSAMALRSPATPSGLRPRSPTNEVSNAWSPAPTSPGRRHSASVSNHTSPRSPTRLSRANSMTDLAPGSQGWRKLELGRIFGMFEPHVKQRDSLVHKSHLIELGRARQWKGLRNSTWAEERHERLVNRLAERREDNCVREVDFVKGFNEKLPHSIDDFSGSLCDLQAITEYVAMHKRNGTWGLHLEIDKGEALPFTPTSSSRPTSPQHTHPGSPHSLRLGSPHHSVAGLSLAEKIFAEHGHFQGGGPAGRFAGTLGGSPLAQGREGLLQRVFRAMDLLEDNGQGVLTKEMILELGQWRKELDQNMGSWGEHQHNRVVQKMKPNRDSMISEKEFVKRFTEKLPHDSTDFENIVREFHEVVEWIRLGRPEGWDPKHWEMPADCGVRSAMEMRLERERRHRLASPSPLTLPEVHQPRLSAKQVHRQTQMLRQMGLRQLNRSLQQLRGGAMAAAINMWRKNILLGRYGMSFTQNPAKPKAHFFDDWIHHVSQWEEKWRSVDDVAMTDDQREVAQQKALLDAKLSKAMEQVGMATMEVDRALQLRNDGATEEAMHAASAATVATTAAHAAHAAVTQAQEARSLAFELEKRTLADEASKQAAVNAVADVLERAIAEHTQLLTESCTQPMGGTELDRIRHALSKQRFYSPAYKQREDEIRAELQAAGDLNFFPSRWGDSPSPPKHSVSPFRDTTAWPIRSMSRSPGSDASVELENTLTQLEKDLGLM